jgi:hypothetical protein
MKEAAQNITHLNSGLDALTVEEDKEIGNGGIEMEETEQNVSEGHPDIEMGVPIDSTIPTPTKSKEMQLIPTTLANDGGAPSNDVRTWRDWYTPEEWSKLQAIKKELADHGARLEDFCQAVAEDRMGRNKDKQMGEQAEGE